MKGPTIVETDKDLVGEWNSTVSVDMRLKNFRGASDDPMSDLRIESGGDAKLAHWNYCRSIADHEIDPASAFASQWEEFKHDLGVVDFTDLLIQGPRVLRNGGVLIVDEAQDLTPLQWSIVRRWGSYMDVFIVAGDDDQLLYQFLGAESETFLSPISEDRVRILSRTHRLSQAVFTWAEQWITKLGKRRQVKEYKPLDDAPEGSVNYRRGVSLSSDALVDELAEHEAKGRSVMVLASCAYMLKPLLANLKRAGVAYGNPYRPTRGDWNPLSRLGKRVATFFELDTKWDRAEVWKKVAPMLRAKGVFRRGGKGAIMDRKGRVDIEFINQHCEEEVRDGIGPWASPVMREAIGISKPEWLRAHVSNEYRQRVEYPIQVFKKRGLDGLRSVPHITVGTIHSVKGGEAEVVYMAPDLSHESWEACRTDEGAARDALTRLFYVGGTRAKKELHLLEPSKRRAFSVQW